MKPLKLVRTVGGQAVELPDAATIIVGRAPDCDLHIPDPTVSRRHAEVSAGPDGVTVRDLDSSNGTFINGKRTDRGTAKTGDVITFGRVACALQEAGETASEPAPAAAPEPAPAPAAAKSGGTIVRQVPVAPPASAIGATAGLANLGVAQGGPADWLLERIVELTFQVMDVDCASVMLGSDGDALVSTMTKNRLGDDDMARVVPRSIARRVANERIAVLTDNAPADVRFQGASIVVQNVRSAMCTPIMARDGTVLGIYYVDNRTATRSFTDDDLQFLIAYAGIAAAAIEGGRVADRNLRDALLQSELHRHFPADIVQSIAKDGGDSVALKVRRLPLVAVFAELRGVPTTVADASPERVATFLRTCTREMISVVFQHGGSVDRTMDGAILALWGAPVPGEDDADRAVEAVVAMLERLNELNREDTARGMPRIRLGAGIGIGDAFGGNVGGDGYEYAIYGRPIDAARHLAAQAGPGEVLLTGPVLDALSMRPAVAAMYTPMRRRDTDQSPVYRLKQ